VGEEVEPGHQQHSVDTQQPMVLEHLADFVEEDAGLGLGGLLGGILPLLVSTEKDFALGKKGAQHASKCRDAGPSKKERTPRCVGNEVEVNDSGDEVTNSISLLHDTAGETASLDRKVLECSG